MTFANLSPCFVYAFTQKFNGYPGDFQFQPFFANVCAHLNEDGTDFNLGLNKSIPSVPTARRMTKTCLTSMQRRNVGYIDKKDILEAVPKDEKVNNLF